MSRPSETLQAAIGSILGALFIVLGATDVVPEKWMSTEVQGALVILVSWIAAGVTWYVATKQREGELRATKDGSVEDVTR